MIAAALLFAVAAALVVLVVAIDAAHARRQRDRLVADCLALDIESQRPDPAVEAFFWNVTDNCAAHERREATRRMRRQHETPFHVWNALTDEERAAQQAAHDALLRASGVAPSSTRA